MQKKNSSRYLYLLLILTDVYKNILMVDLNCLRFQTLNFWL